MKLTKTDKIIKAFEKEIKKLIAEGKTPEKAVRLAYEKYPVMKVMETEISPQLITEMDRGAKGVFPLKILKDATALVWTADQLTLSQRTTKGGKEITKEVAKIIKDAIKKGDTIEKTALKLFDGYGYGHVLPTQDIPEFMKKLADIGRMKDYKGREFRKTLRSVERQLKRTNITGMKIAYKEMKRAIEVGNEEKINKAIYVATQEKTRYFARRIARTEMARAYGDGVMGAFGEDDDCVAFQWRISSGHPFSDICNLYASADLYGMGEGIFPKDKVPSLPLHPNCMCHLRPIMDGSELLKGNEKEQIEKGGMAYIKNLKKYDQERLLGERGRKDVLAGRRKWTEKARGYSREVMKSRIVTTLDGNLQRYNPIEKTGETITIGKAGASIINAVKIKNANWDMFVSAEVALKPRKLHELNQNLKNALTLINAKTEYIKPKIIIINSKQSLNSVAAYRARDNTMFLVNLTSTVEKAVGKQFVDGNESLSTVVHELLHWKDAQLFREKYGDIDTREQQERYIAFVNNRARRKLDAIKKNGYDIEKEGSMYERNSFEKKVFDEAYTEYRTRTLIKRR